MRDKGESGWLSAIYHVIREGLLISQAALRQRLVSRRYPLPETGNPFVTQLARILLSNARLRLPLRGKGAASLPEPPLAYRRPTGGGS